MPLRNRSIVLGFWFLILGLTVARVAFHDRIVPTALGERGAITPSLTMSAIRPG